MFLRPNIRPALFAAMIVATLTILSVVGCRNPSPTVVPDPTPTFVSATPTPRAVESDASHSDGGDMVSRGANVFESSICATCHAIEGTMAEGTIGPDLTNIASIAANRQEGLSAEEYIRESIEDPSVFLAPDCPGGISPCMALMPEGLKEVLGSNYEAVIAYLLSLK